MQLDSCFRSFPNPSRSTHPVCVVHSVCQSLLRLLLSKLPVSQLCLRFLNTLLIRSCREGLHHHDSESGRPASTAYPRGYIRPDPLSEDGIVFYGGGDVNVTCWTPRPASSMATPSGLASLPQHTMPTTNTSTSVARSSLTQPSTSSLCSSDAPRKLTQSA